MSRCLHYPSDMERVRLLALCPQTRRPLDTGITLNPVELEGLRPLRAQVFCPFCVAIHVWSQENSYLEDRHRPPFVQIGKAL